MDHHDEIDANGGEPLEKRYIHTKIVGGAYNCKLIQKPKSIEDALKNATFGRKSDESLMIKGIDLERYKKHDKIISISKPSNLFVSLNNFSGGSNNTVPGIPVPPVFIPTYPSSPAPVSPVPPIPSPITYYWDTDYSIWDTDKIVGQTYWDY